MPRASSTPLLALPLEATSKIAHIAPRVETGSIGELVQLRQLLLPTSF